MSLALFFATMLLSGCIREELSLLEDCGKGHATVQLSISTGAMTKAPTRADGDPVTVAPETDEAKLHTLRVYVFTEDGRPAGHYYTDDTKGAIPNKLYMDMVVYSEPTQRVRFYVIANEGAVSMSSTSTWTWHEALTESQINDFYFTSVTNSISSKGLPMYCKTNVIELNTSTIRQNTADNHDGHEIISSQVTLELRRPVAKLGLFAAKEQGEDAQLKILSAKLLSQGLVLRNYMMPQENLKSKQLPFGMATDYNLPLAVTTVSAALVTEGENPDNRADMSKYTPLLGTPYYANENPYGSTMDNWSQAGTNEGDATKGNILEITYQFGNEEPKTGTVYMPAIERNKYYTVLCLMKGGSAGGLTIEYGVADWEDATDTEWSLNFTYPTYTNPLDPYITTEKNEQGKHPQPTVIYNESYIEGDTDDWADGWETDGSYRFKFQMYSPEGMRWTPTLTKTANYSLKVYRQEKDAQGNYLVDENNKYVYTLLTNATVGSWDWVAGQNIEYILVVRATQPYDSTEGTTSNSTELVISYDTSAWSFATENSLLLINGAAGATGWMGSDDPETIVISRAKPEIGS